jgi:hypothetical protein
LMAFAHKLNTRFNHRMNGWHCEFLFSSRTHHSRGYQSGISICCDATSTGNWSCYREDIQHPWFRRTNSHIGWGDSGDFVESKDRSENLVFLRRARLSNFW